MIRAKLRTFPEVTVGANELGRPADGTVPTCFFNNEFFIGLKPYSEWNGKYRRKDELIEAIKEKLDAFPGIVFNFTQPAEDAVDEAETGLKSSLAVKIFGSDLRVLEDRGAAIKRVLEHVRGISGISVIKQLGQPSLAINIDREKIARYGLNVADINGLSEAAVGGTAATQVVQGERLFERVVRPQPQIRGSPGTTGQTPVRTRGGREGQQGGREGSRAD